MIKRVFTGVLILSCLVLCSCNSMKKNKENRAELIPIFQENIINYINSVDGNFFDKEWLYYSVHIFNKKDTEYFTVWVNTIYPSYISNCCDTSNYEFSMFDINNRKLIIINEKDKSNLLFTTNRKIKDNAKSESERMNEGVIYDGQYFMQTYKVGSYSGEIVITKLDTVISDCIQCNDLIIEDIEIEIE